MRGINIIDSIKLLYGIFRFSIDLITKRGNEDRVFTFSYYLPDHKIIIKFRDRNKDICMALRPKTGDAHDILIGEYYELHNWFYPGIINGIFVDVSAHIGSYTIRNCKDAEIVIAIEP